jgi:hypothetical protein
LSRGKLILLGAFNLLKGDALDDQGWNRFSARSFCRRFWFFLVGVCLLIV